MTMPYNGSADGSKPDDSDDPAVSPSNLRQDDWQSGRPEHAARPPGARRKTATLVLAGVALGFVLGLFFAWQTSWGKPDRPSLYDDANVLSVFERASPAVVEIEVVRNIGDLPVGIPFWGSGFLIDRDGHILTNYHVVARGDEFIVRLDDGRELKAERLGVSEADDLAALKVDAAEIAGIEPLALADSSKVAPGQMAIAIGSPFREFNTVSVGIVSGIGRGHSSVLNRPIPNMIQTDAPLNPGNSGGPLLDSDGQVIGVNSSIRIESGSSRVEEFRLGLAVPSNTARQTLPHLLASVDLRWPGIGIQGTSTARGMMEQGFPKGIVVTRVFADSPAMRAGIVPFRRGAPGDVITAVDSNPVESVADMVGYLNSKASGDTVTVTLFRDWDDIDVDVVLAPWPDEA